MTTMEFFQSLDQNKATEMFNEVKSPEKAYEIAKDNGATDTFEQFVATTKELNEALYSMSEEEINAIVAGEANTSEVKNTSITTTTFISIAATASAI